MLKRIGLAIGLSALIGGYFFYIFDPSTNGLFVKSGFMYQGDCEAARQWSQTLEQVPTPVPSGTATPAPGASAFDVTSKCWASSEAPQ